MNLWDLIYSQESTQPADDLYPSPERPRPLVPSSLGSHYFSESLDLPALESDSDYLPHSAVKERERRSAGDDDEEEDDAFSVVYDTQDSGTFQTAIQQKKRKRNNLKLMAKKPLAGGPPPAEMPEEYRNIPDVTFNLLSVISVEADAFFV